jgi:hypothetical protein
VASHHHHRRALLGLGLAAALSTWTAVAAQSADTDRLKEQVISLLNQERAARGLPALHRVRALENAAQAYSETMMRATAGGPVYLAHLGPDGSTLGKRVSAMGYNWYSLGETLAAGQKSADQVLAEWLGSPLHRENLFSHEYRDVGIGIAMGPGTWSDGRLDPQVLWWTADLGASPDTASDDPSLPPPTTVVTPPPTIMGYATLSGMPVRSAQFGSLLMVTGQNLGLSGAVSFHGRPTSALLWSPTSLLVWVPLQATYPDVGPITVTVNGQTAFGPDFTTTQPASLFPPVPVVSPPAPAQPQPSLPPSNAAPAGMPTIKELWNSRKQRIDAVPQGQLITIRGLGFGTNASRQGRVLFVTGAGAQLYGSVWGWGDDTINVFTPFVRGALTVAVQTTVNGSVVTSNRVSLTIQ